MNTQILEGTAVVSAPSAWPSTPVPHTVVDQFAETESTRVYNALWCGEPTDDYIEWLDQRGLLQ